MGHGDTLMLDRFRRRRLLTMMASSAACGGLLGACTQNQGASGSTNMLVPTDRDYSSEEHTVLRVRRDRFESRFLPQIVPSPYQYAVGTIIVDNVNNYLYRQETANTAIRYGVGVGRAGRAWSGGAVIQLKRRWPAWNPTPRMRAQEPTLPSYVAPGNHNPLGARALYLFQGGEDTLYRIHGTSEPWTVGTQASSGCIRMLNEDIIDLYDRVQIGSRVVVK